eukprot:SAG11_NODE_23103_length_395_cov_0.662162_1_plen_102_part_01
MEGIQGYAGSSDSGSSTSSSDSGDSDDDSCSSGEDYSEDTGGGTAAERRKRCRPAIMASEGRHGGRQRTFAHVEGNWATYAYVAVRPDAMLKSLVSRLSELP